MHSDLDNLSQQQLVEPDLKSQPAQVWSFEQKCFNIFSFRVSAMMQDASTAAGLPSPDEQSCGFCRTDLRPGQNGTVAAVESPNFPHAYPANSSCLWLLQTKVREAGSSLHYRGKVIYWLKGSVLFYSLKFAENDSYRNLR